MTRGETRRVTALVERAVAPAGDLPPVGTTDAVAAFDTLLRAGPLTSRIALRALLCLPTRWAAAAGGGMLSRIAASCYYGDARVMRVLGYDADAVLARARA